MSDHYKINLPYDYRTDMTTWINGTEDSVNISNTSKVHGFRTIEIFEKDFDTIINFLKMKQKDLERMRKNI